MNTKSQQSKDKESAISALNRKFIEVLNIAKEIASDTPVKATFDSAIVILRIIRVSHLLPFCCIDCKLRYA